MKRLALVAAFFVTAAAAAAVTLRHIAIDAVESRLRRTGLGWESRTDHVTEIRWSDVTGSGVELDSLSVHAGWPVKVDISGGTIDLAPLAKKKTSEPSTSKGALARAAVTWQPPWQLQCSEIAIVWGGQSLLKDLSGQAYPQLLLANEATQISARWGAKPGTILSGAIDGDLPHDAIHGRGKLSFSLGDPVSFTLEAPNAQPEHSFIANRRLPKNQLNARGVWSPETGEMALDGQFGGVSWSGIGKAKAGTVKMDLRVPLTPLKEIVRLFGDGIPEAARTKMSGELSVDGHLEGPPWVWRLEPGAKDLTAAGALPADYLGPIIRWTTPGKDKIKRCRKQAAPEEVPDCTWEPSQIPHITGPRTPDWISHSRAGWMPEAVIAAEDIRFKAHDGYDLVAIQEALADASSDERLRGGSTITQQLAKNLFLDGRRTLQRKLRELLFSLSIEERMTKDAILTLYLNVVEFGPGIWGIKEAADAWFLKSPEQLSVREAAFLSSILPAPNMWHRRITESGRVPVSRVNGVLDRMRRRGSLSKSDHRRARAETLRVVPPAQRE